MAGGPKDLVLSWIDGIYVALESTLNEIIENSMSELAFVIGRTDHRDGLGRK